MRIATWNVNGIRAREAQVVDWVRRERPDVVCLQEIKATAEQVPAALCDLEGYWCLWHGMKAYSGVGLHLRKEAFPGVSPEFFHPAFDHESRIVAARLPGLVVASVYVPNGNKDYPAKVRFLEALGDWIGGTVASGADLAVCGDLNVARAEIDVHPKERRPAIGQSPEERAIFERILSRGVVDVGRALDPQNEGMFTWWAPWRSMRQRNIGWRLDYVLASGRLAARATSCPVFREVGSSDHGPVLATFADGAGTGSAPGTPGA
jgi:exodeoxyribonuclease-3